jgi:hypothetical protein
VLPVIDHPWVIIGGLCIIAGVGVLVGHWRPSRRNRTSYDSYQDL